MPLTITGTAGALSHSAEVTLAVNASIAGSLGGTLTTPAGTQNLSTLGTLDWAHWGLSSATSFHHKAGITPQISNVSVVGGGTPFAYGNHPFGFSWSGGTPTASATASSTGIFISGVNNGFQITAPADTTSRTLTVYVGVWRAQGRLVAHLSDNAAPDYVDTMLNNGAGTTPGLYTVVYQAASAGQTLTITYTQANVTSGNVTLQAATLR